MVESILVYSHKLTPRIKYTFRFILKDILGVLPEFTSSKEDFVAFEGAKLSYAYRPLQDEVNIVPHGLLTEVGVMEQNISVTDAYTEEEDVPCFFQVQSGDLSFDMFAASFYLISRYEEYLPFIKDTYSRYTPEQSLAFENDFLTIPVVDKWAYMLRSILSRRFPKLNFFNRNYSFIPTIDVDNAWAYKHKGVMRTVGGVAKSLSDLQFAEVMQRFQVIFNLKKDPYDTFDHLLKLHSEYELDAKYFFLFAEYGVNDKNINTNNTYFQRLIKSASDYFEIGIHPSFASNEDVDVLKREIASLSDVLKADIVISRQHFLILSLPDTYRNLIDLDIRHDYSMGYASAMGFRAGTCTPFLFYDLDLEQETKLRIHPFQVMDATLKYYMKTSPEDVMDELRPLLDAVKSVDGTLVTLWHNESISGTGAWAGWEQVYQEMIKEAVSR